MKTKAFAITMALLIVLSAQNVMAGGAGTGHPAQSQKTEKVYQTYYSHFLNEPVYLQTDNATYVARFSKLYRLLDDKGNEEVVLDMGAGTTARNKFTGQVINDFRSFYITDTTYGYYNGREQVILVAGLLLLPDEYDKTLARPVDIVMQCDMTNGITDTLLMSIRHPIRVSVDQHDMKESALYEYLQDILFPRIALKKDENRNIDEVFVLMGGMDLDIADPPNRQELLSRGYNTVPFFEIVQIRNDYGTHLTMDDGNAVFSGPISVFDKNNPEFRIPELNGKNHYIDPNLIVFRYNPDVPGQLIIASVGDNNSDYCTALEINIMTKPADTYYWIEKTKFLEMLGINASDKGAWSMWTEKDMDSYISK